MSDLSIGKHAPIPRYIVKKVPNKKTDIAIGLRKGLENLLTFSMKGKIIIPSGINVYCADERSQLKNKNKAMTVLRSRLLKVKQNEEKEKYAKERKDQVGTGDRSERIRTYNFPQSRITDHRINYSSHALNESLMGDLDHLLDSLNNFDQNLRLEALSKSDAN